MAQGGGGSGRFVLYAVLGVVGVLLALKLLGWIAGALLSLLWYALIIGAVVGGIALVVGASRRRLGRRDQRQLPRR